MGRIAHFSTGSHVRLFEALGGVPDSVVPVNLKAGVSSPGFYEAKLNRSYGDLLDHYGTTAVPARAGKPRDKAKVETAVRHVERCVTAPLRNRVFFSLAELNAALAALAAVLNASVSRHLGASRLNRLERLDRPALRPLPPHRWELSRWERCRAGKDYHVPLGRVRYSVPYGLAGRRLWARRTQRVVEFSTTCLFPELIQCYAIWSNMHFTKHVINTAPYVVAKVRSRSTERPLCVYRTNAPPVTTDY